MAHFPLSSSRRAAATLVLHVILAVVSFAGLASWHSPPLLADDDEELLSKAELACKQLDKLTLEKAYNAISISIRGTIPIRNMIRARLASLRAKTQILNQSKTEILEHTLARIDETIWEAISGIGLGYLQNANEDSEDFPTGYWDILTLREIAKACSNSYSPDHEVSFSTYYLSSLENSFAARKAALRNYNLSFKPDEIKTLDALAATYEEMLQANGGRADFNREQVIAEARSQNLLPYQDEKTRQTLVKSDQIRPEWHGRYGTHRESIGGELVYLEQDEFSKLIARREQNPPLWP